MDSVTRAMEAIIRARRAPSGLTRAEHQKRLGDGHALRTANANATLGRLPRLKALAEKSKASVGLEPLVTQALERVRWKS